MQDQISTLGIDFGLIGPELALLVAAAVILLFAFSRKIEKLAPWIGAAGLLTALGLSIGQWTVGGDGFSGMVSVDEFGVIFKILFCVASFLSLLMAHRYFQVLNIARSEFYALLLVSTMGMMVMANTSDLVVMFLGLEIMSVPLYVMAGFNRRSLESNEAGIKYFVMGAFATGFLLMGIAFIFGAAETTNLERIITDFAFIQAHAGAYLYFGAALVLIGFGFKVAAVPFHNWVPDVYQGAPTPVTAFFSVAPKAAAFAVLLRIFAYGLADLDILTPIFSALAVLTMTVGNIMALRQDNVKRMLAYSSISHAGYILVAFAVGGGDAISAAIFYLIGYTMFNLGGFAIVTLLETRTGSKSDFGELVGLSRSNPYLAFLLAVFMFALSGFPPTVGFFGKLYIFSAAVKGDMVWLAVVGVMNSFLSVYYYLRVIKVSYFDTFEGKLSPVKVPLTIGFILLVTLVGTLGIGLFPDRILEMSRAALSSLLG
ncbi:MAG: NADH-quinone oxidoreductase subunit N [Candidatus Zixiibacteriota bacterium]